MVDFLTAFLSAHGGPSLFLISLVSATIAPPKINKMSGAAHNGQAMGAVEGR